MLSRAAVPEKETGKRHLRQLRDLVHNVSHENRESEAKK